MHEPSPEQYLLLHRNGAPEEYLAVEVLRVALSDAGLSAANLDRTYVSRPEHEQAVRFLTAERGQWAQARAAWSEAAGICPDWLREIALRRIKPEAAEPPPPPKPRPTPEPQPRKKIRGHISVAAKERLVACRRGTRQAALVDALKDGATWDQLRAACPTWADQSILCAIYDDLSRGKRYGVRTELRDGAPTFFLVYPEGVTEPPPHR